MARRVLVVDDEPDIRTLARLALERVGGHEVVTAESGLEALETAAREPFDAIVLDVMMPGLDGPSTVRKLREQEATRDVPVVMLTAKAQAAERRDLAELDVSGVLAKPFDPMALADELAATLGWTDG